MRGPAGRPVKKPILALFANSEKPLFSGLSLCHDTLVPGRLPSVLLLLHCVCVRFGAPGNTPHIESRIQDHSVEPRAPIMIDHMVVSSSS